MRRLAVALVLVLAACGGGGGGSEWDDGHRFGMIDECINVMGRDPTFCRCLLREAEERYPDPEDILDADREAMDALVARCEGE